MPSTGQSIAPMMSSNAFGYFLLTSHSRGCAAPYQTSAAAIGRDAASTSGRRAVWWRGRSGDGAQARRRRGGVGGGRGPERADGGEARFGQVLVGGFGLD